MALWLISQQHQYLKAEAYGAVLVNAASEAAARTAAIAAAPTPELKRAASVLQYWAATQLSVSDGTLPGAVSTCWFNGTVPALFVNPNT